jgi:HK97 family phage prohead protease
MESASFTWEVSADTKAVEDFDHFYIEGYASDFGIDRDEEAFEPGAFSKAIDKFLGSNPVLLFHHQYDKALGQVEDLRYDEKGLFMRARIDEPASGSWSEDVVAKVKKGTIKGLSVGGRFKRRGDKIYEADLNEISVTPLPVNPNTLFAVAEKAFTEDATSGGEQLSLMADRLSELREKFDRIDNLLDR